MNEGVAFVDQNRNEVLENLTKTLIPRRMEAKHKVEWRARNSEGGVFVYELTVI